MVRHLLSVCYAESATSCYYRRILLLLLIVAANYQAGPRLCL